MHRYRHARDRSGRQARPPRQSHPAGPSARHGRESRSRRPWRRTGASPRISKRSPTWATIDRAIAISDRRQRATDAAELYDQHRRQHRAHETAEGAGPGLVRAETRRELRVHRRRGLRSRPRYRSSRRRRTEISSRQNRTRRRSAARSARAPSRRHRALRPQPRMPRVRDATAAHASIPMTRTSGAAAKRRSRMSSLAPALLAASATANATATMPVISTERRSAPDTRVIHSHMTTMAAIPQKTAKVHPPRYATPIASGASTSADATRSNKSLPGRPTGTGRAGSASDMIMNRFARSVRQTVVRDGDIRRWRLRAWNDRSRANRSERKQVRCRQPAKAKSSKAAARRWCE